MIEILISILIIIGVFFNLLGSIGLVRLPDIYARIHAATKSATLGIAFLILATFLYFWIVEGQFIGNILLAILFVFLTAPVGAQIMSRSAHRTKVPLSNQSAHDDLKNSYEKRQKNG